MVGNYDERLCVSKLNKYLIETKCRDKFIESKSLENVDVPINAIITSMIKTYIGFVSLKELEDEFNKCNK